MCSRLHSRAYMPHYRAWHRLLLSSSVLLSSSTTLVACSAEPSPTSSARVLRHAAAPVRCDPSWLPRIYFLLTSTPDRASRLPRVLASLRKQSMPPSGIILTVARHYDPARFSNTSFSLPSEMRQSLDITVQQPVLQVQIVDADRGPLLKYFGAARIEGDSQAIAVVGDDDVFYGHTFIEDFACSVAHGPANTVYSNQVDADCKWLGGCVMGFRGVAMRATMLHTLIDFAAPPECFLADDVAVTYWLTHVRGYRVQKLALRTKHRLDTSFAESGSSIHSYHKSAGFRINKACQAALRGRKSTVHASVASMGARADTSSQGVS